MTAFLLGQSQVFDKFTSETKLGLGRENELAGPLFVVQCD